MKNIFLIKGRIIKISILDMFFYMGLSVKLNILNVSKATDL